MLRVKLKSKDKNKQIPKKDVKGINEKIKDLEKRVELLERKWRFGEN